MKRECGSREQRPVWQILVALAALVLGSAGGCAGKGEDSKKSGGTSTCVSYEASQSPSPGSVGAQEGAGSRCSQAEVEILVTDVSDVFAVSFVATFSSSVVRYDGYSDSGSFLGDDGTSLVVVVDESVGRVEIGVTRVGVGGAEAVGSRRLLRLFFSPRDLGAGALSLEDAVILDSETPPREKSGILWFGGSFQALVN